MSPLWPNLPTGGNASAPETSGPTRCHERNEPPPCRRPAPSIAGSAARCCRPRAETNRTTEPDTKRMVINLVQGHKNRFDEFSRSLGRASPRRARASTGRRSGQPAARAMARLPGAAAVSRTILFDEGKCSIFPKSRKRDVAFATGPWQANLPQVATHNY
jgi:hypothetical protein